jgi:hypothetical protein
MGRENGEDYGAEFLVMLNTWEAALQFISAEFPADRPGKPQAIEIARLLGWTAGNAGGSNDDPNDPHGEGVARLLNCTGRWAYDLTEKARAEDKAKRNAEIIRLKDEGLTVREIKEETGASLGTISGVQKLKTSKTEQPDETAQPSDPPAWKQKLEDLASEPAQNWAAALRALRLINEQVPVDDLFAERFPNFDHVFGPELDLAHAWINELRSRALHSLFGEIVLTAGSESACAGAPARSL